MLLYRLEFPILQIYLCRAMFTYGHKQSKSIFQVSSKDNKTFVYIISNSVQIKKNTVTSSRSSANPLVSSSVSVLVPDFLLETQRRMIRKILLTPSCVIELYAIYLQRLSISIKREK